MTSSLPWMRSTYLNYGGIFSITEDPFGRQGVTES